MVNTWRQSFKFTELCVRFVAEHNILWEVKLSHLSFNLINTLYTSRDKRVKIRHGITSFSFLIYMRSEGTQNACVCVCVCTHTHTHTHTKQNFHFSRWYFLINHNKMTVITYMINLWQHIPAGHTENTLKHKQMQQLICHCASQ